MNIEAAKAVLDEMDGECGDMYDGTITLNDEWYRSHIQRIRDALKEEPQGDAVAIRNALKHCIEELSPYCDGGARRDEVLEEAKAALAKPPRNCEVGTPDEQSERFDAHCRKYMGCKACTLRDADGSVPKHCEFRWAQMPYNESEAKWKNCKN